MTATKDDQPSLNEANQKPDVVYDPVDSGRDTSTSLDKQLHTAAALISSGLENKRVGREQHYQGLAQTYGIWLAVQKDEALEASIAQLYASAKAASTLNPSQFIKGVPKLVDQVVAVQFPDVDYKRRMENSKTLLAAEEAKITELTFISWMKKSGGKTKIHTKPKVAPAYAGAKRLLDLPENEAAMSRNNPTDVLLDNDEIYAMIVHRVGPDYEVMSVIVDKKGSRKAVNTQVAKQFVPDKATLLASVDILSPSGQTDPEPALDDEPLAIAS